MAVFYLLRVTDNQAIIPTGEVVTTDNNTQALANKTLTTPIMSGSVQFAQNQGLQFRIENRTSDPGSPAVGETWIRTDL